MFERCDCHSEDYPPFTGEIHGLSQALLSKSKEHKIFWFIILIICTSCGTASTVLIIIENIQGPTATSTTIKLVPTLEFPAITVCTKISDVFRFDEIFNDVKKRLPNATKTDAADLFRFWIGGSGIENIPQIVKFNRTYLEQLRVWYGKWSEGYSHKVFFDLMQDKYGYSCDDFFYSCELGGQLKNCCEEIFKPASVIRKGRCYQTRKNVNQTEIDFSGRLIVKVKGLPSITSPQHNYSQPQITVYINDNYEHVLEFPRYYLYKNAWNDLRFTARFVELLEHPGDCTTRIFGKDAICFIKNWVVSNFVEPFNCTVPYLDNIGLSAFPACDPSLIVNDYYKKVLLHADLLNVQNCVPGCQKMEYEITLQQSWALEQFKHYKFNLEASFYDLQYEHVKEVMTTSLPGFMSQIGGQFGFFLGFSIITLLQFLIYSINQLYGRFFRPTQIEIINNLTMDECNCHSNGYPPFIGEIHGLSQALLSKSLKLRLLWWIILFICTGFGILTTVLVFIDYIQGFTITSTTIKLLPSLEFPAITICPKNPSTFNFEQIAVDIKTRLPYTTNEIAIDLISFWLGGSGLGNIRPLSRFNETYIDKLSLLYEKWSAGYDYKKFYDLVQKRYGYSCDEFFHSCELGGVAKDCCEEIFVEKPVMRRGMCYQTRRNINQTKSNDIGKLGLKIKSVSNITLAEYIFYDPQPQINIYINEYFGHLLDYVDFTLFKDEFTRAYFTARFVELLERPGECTTKIIGKDNTCFVRDWLNSNIVGPFNCTLPYLTNVSGISELSICNPSVIAKNYHDKVELVESGTFQRQNCLPGCLSWIYDVSVQQTLALEPFDNYSFHLESSFYGLQYEHVKEVLATSFPGFMSQLGGQFGFFLGLSIITMLQIVIHAINSVGLFFYRLFRPIPRESVRDFALNVIPNEDFREKINEENISDVQLTSCSL